MNLQAGYDLEETARAIGPALSGVGPIAA